MVAQHARNAASPKPSAARAATKSGIVAGPAKCPPGAFSFQSPIGSNILNPICEIAGPAPPATKRSAARPNRRRTRNCRQMTLRAQKQRAVAAAGRVRRGRVVPKFQRPRAICAARSAEKRPPKCCSAWAATRPCTAAPPASRATGWCGYALCWLRFFIPFTSFPPTLPAFVGLGRWATKRPARRLKRSELPPWQEKTWTKQTGRRPR